MSAFVRRVLVSHTYVPYLMQFFFYFSWRFQILLPFQKIWTLQITTNLYLSCFSLPKKTHKHVISNLHLYIFIYKKSKLSFCTPCMQSCARLRATFVLRLVGGPQVSVSNNWKQHRFRLQRRGREARTTTVFTREIVYLFLTEEKYMSGWPLNKYIMPKGGYFVYLQRKGRQAFK